MNGAGKHRRSVFSGGSSRTESRTRHSSLPHLDPTLLSSTHHSICGRGIFRLHHLSVTRIKACFVGEHLRLDRLRLRIQYLSSRRQASRLSLLCHSLFVVFCSTHSLFDRCRSLSQPMPCNLLYILFVIPEPHCDNISTKKQHHQQTQTAQRARGVSTRSDSPKASPPSLRFRSWVLDRARLVDRIDV